MVCVTWGSNGKYKLFKTKLNSFLAGPIYETQFLVPFYEDINIASFGFSFLFLVAIVLLTMYLVKYKKNDLKPFNGIISKNQQTSPNWMTHWLNRLEKSASQRGWCRRLVATWQEWKLTH